MIRVGTAGWSYPDWEGIVYPREKPRGFHPLRHLARFVDCVEVNASFYGPLRPATSAAWLACVREHPAFRFTAKLHRSFTHEALPEDDAALERQAADFLAGLEPVRAAGRLSGLLVQFPLSFRHTRGGERRLERLEACFAHVPLVLELRHRSWYEAAPLALIERLGYSLARIDLPDAEDHPPSDVPAIGALGYLRLHGRNRETWFARGAGRDQRYDYLYGPDELDQLVRLVERLSGKVDETLVVTNNHFSGKALANAIEIKAALESERPAAPPELVSAYPRLARIARASGQRPLFE